MSIKLRQLNYLMPQVARRSQGQVSAPNVDVANVVSMAPKRVNLHTYSIEILGEDYSRNYLLIQNPTASSVYLGVGGDATTNGIHIPPGGNWEPSKAPSNKIFALGSYEGQGLLIIDGE